MTLHLLILAILLAGSAFCSGSETALFNLSRGELHRLAGGSRSGRLVAALMQRPRRVLNTLLLANMLVNVGFHAISAMMLLRLRSRGWPGWAVGAALLAPPLLVIFLGEVSPKAAAFALGRSWALAVAPLVAGLIRLLSPALWILDAVFVLPLTKLLTPRSRARRDIGVAELNALMDLSAKRGLITHDTNSLLQEIFELRDLRVAAIMVPRVDVIAYDFHAPRSGLVRLFRRTHLRRIPIYDGDLDHILGVVHAKRVLLSPQTPLGEMLTPVIYLPEAANLERALFQLRAKGRQMAVVVDEYGGTAGLVTMEDILEEIVGDIPDPDRTEEGPAVEQVGPAEYLIDGNLAIHDWYDAFAINIDEQQNATVGGLAMSLLGRVPRPGDRVRYRNLELTVESMRGRRVGKVRLLLHPDPGEDLAAGPAKGKSR